MRWSVQTKAVENGKLVKSDDSDNEYSKPNDILVSYLAKTDESSEFLWARDASSYDDQEPTSILDSGATRHDTSISNSISELQTMPQLPVR